MTQPVGWLTMSVLLMHTAHAAEVRHEMLQSAAVMRRQSTDQTIQRRLALVNSLDFFTMSQISVTVHSHVQIAYILSREDSK